MREAPILANIYLQYVLDLWLEKHVSKKSRGKVIFKWLNRRSQRKSYTWAKFRKHWQGDWQIPQPRVVEEWGSQSSRQGEMRLV